MPLFEARGSTPMDAHIAWNCCRNMGSRRMSSRYLSANSSKLDRNRRMCSPHCCSFVCARLSPRVLYWEI